MGKMQTGKRIKKVVVLGVDVQHHAIYSEVLICHNVVFVVSQEEALTSGGNADVLAVNIDKYRGFLQSMLDRVFNGSIVAISTSRQYLNRPHELSGGKKLAPVCQRTAPTEIVRMLAV